MIEVERKYEIPLAVWPQVQQRLGEMQFIGEIDNSDYYFDTVTFTLFRQAVFVRVRNQQRIEFKYNEQADAAHTHCREEVFSLAPDPHQAAQMHALFARFLPGWHPARTAQERLARNVLHELARIENHRTRYSWQGLIVCVDRVARLGDFLEIEAQCQQEEEIPQALSRIERVTEGLALPEVRVGYVERWLRLYRPQVYAFGKYQEEPDAGAWATGVGGKNVQNHSQGQQAD